MSKPETIKVYYASLFSSDRLEDVLAGGDAPITYRSLGNTSAPLFYETVKAAENSCHWRNGARFFYLPTYIYEAELPVSDTGIINANEPLPDFYKQRFDELMQLELSASPEIIEESGFSMPRDMPFLGLRSYLHDVFGLDRVGRWFKSIGIKSAQGRGEFIVFDRELLTEGKHYRHFDNRSFQRELGERLKRAPINSAQGYFVTEFSKGMRGLLLKPLSRDAEARESFYEGLKKEFPEMTRVEFDRYIDMQLKVVFGSRCISVDFNQAKKYKSIPKTVEEIDRLLPQKFFTSTMVAELAERPQDGRKFIIKEGVNAAAVQAEHEAYRIYEAFDVRVPKSACFKKKDKFYLVQEYIEGPRLYDIAYSFMPRSEAEELRDKVAEHFVIDALIGNYDAGSQHFSNMIVMKNGEICRIDAGAALGFHYNGSKKIQGEGRKQWGVSLADFHFFRSIHPGRVEQVWEQNYGGITNQEIFDGLIRAEKKLSAVKKVASKENYRVIEGRLKLAKAHFLKLCTLEKRFQSLPTGMPSVRARKKVM